MILRGSVIVLALAGLADALYFTFAYYGRVRKSRWVPEVLCAREGSSCVTVVRTPYGSVFGVPNSLLGIVYYVLLVLWAVALQSARLTIQINMTSYIVTFTDLLIAAGAVTVALGFYLIFALRRILHTDCPFCYLAHAINLALLVLLVIAR
ncbi:MAG TPA: vitamin K epoxide reductase family protein [Terriglobia bacterium]|nr:vitamin K epoxide reductase family protein [Terriglobia bacterium]